MAAPIYFFPGLDVAMLRQGPRLDPEVLARHGLLDVLGDVQDVDRECSLWGLKAAGPGGSSGALLCALAAAGERSQMRCGYFPDQQTWTQVRAEPSLWIGLDRDQPVTPECLRRGQLFKGYQLELADGGTWTIPVVRRPDGSTELPQDYGYDLHGRFGKTIKARYKEAWDATARLIEWWQRDCEFLSAEDERQLVELALRILGLNYRLGPYEQSLLRPIDSLNWATICACAIDGPRVMRFQEMEQKKTPSPADPETSTT